MKKSHLRNVPTKADLKLMRLILKEAFESASSDSLERRSSDESPRDALSTVINSTEELLQELGVQTPMSLTDCLYELDRRMDSRELPEVGTGDHFAELMMRVVKDSSDPVIESLWAYRNFMMAEMCRDNGDLDRCIQLLSLGAGKLAHACTAAAAREASISAIAKASSRHEGNRRRREMGRRLWLSKTWRVDADAIRAIMVESNVTYKTAERWVLEWKRAQ